MSNPTSGDALWDGSLASLSLELLSLSESDPELLSDPLWLLESSRELSAPSLLCCEGSELLKTKMRENQETPPKAQTEPRILALERIKCSVLISTNQKIQHN